MWERVAEAKCKESAPINSRLNVVVRSPTPFGLGRNGCWPSRGSQLPRALPFIFSLCCPLNDRRRAAHSFFKIGRLFSLFLFSCPSLALLRLLILLLFLMSGNVHPNPGPIFPCSVCTGNVIWRGKSVQCCACSKWVHLRCSFWSLIQFSLLTRPVSALDSLHLIKVCTFLSPFRMGLTNPGRALERSCLLSNSLKLLTLSGIPPFSTNLFQLASLLALLVRLNLFFLIGPLL